MKVLVHVPCPYCDHENKMLFDVDDIHSKIRPVTCDPEEGGCCTRFVIDLALRPVFSIYKLELDSDDNEG